jgi:hypothetical protein
MRDRRITALVVGGLIAFYAIQIALRDVVDEATLAALLMSVVGGGLLASALVIARRQRRFVGMAWRATGTVVEIVTRPGRRGPGRAPVLRFTTPTGETFQFQSSFTSSAMLDIGKQFPVLFDPHDPRHAQIEGFLAQWLVPLILGGVGAMFAVVGMILLVVGLV